MLRSREMCVHMYTSRVLDPFQHEINASACNATRKGREGTVAE